MPAAPLRYAITDRTLFGGDLDAMLAHILSIASIADGIDYLQIRERDLPTATLEHFASRVMQALARVPQRAGPPRRARVLINHRADIAIACGADGVHLRSGSGSGGSGSGELSPRQVRELYRAAHLPKPFISLSCHTVAQVENALGADLILFGPVFEKPLPLPAQPLPGTGLELLAEACRAAHPTPVLALGGVTGANRDACLRSGAAGIAGIRLFMRG